MAASTFTTKQLANKLDRDGLYIHYGIIDGATNGDKSCQVVIGDLFYGNHQFEDAMNWYRLAADKNYATAQYKMGKMYQKGGGVAVDYKLAMDWYLKAAAQNNSKARKAIGSLFENGLGVPVDSARANEWYNKGSTTSWLKGFKKNTPSIDKMLMDAQQFITNENHNGYLKHNLQANSEILNENELVNDSKQTLEIELKNKDQKIASLEKEVDMLSNTTDEMKKKLEYLEKLLRNTMNSTTDHQQHEKDSMNILKEKNRGANQKINALEKLLQKQQHTKDFCDNDDLYYISSSDNENN